jgi:hypothetical protein
MKSDTFRSVALAATVLASSVAQAAIPSSSPYVTDSQNLYVQDDTSQGISSLNMVLCVIGSMDPGDMVNLGPYIALVDVNRCQNKGGNDASAAGATNYASAVVSVTRASNSDPMIAKVWLSMTEQGNATNVYAYLSATQSPGAAPPYGVFRMDYIGQKNGQVGFNGYIDSQPGVIKFLETGSNSSNTALAMTASSTTAGSGTMNVGGGSSTFNFAYDSGFFRRSDGSNDECFDRSKSNAQVSVWQYGTYNANDGSRVDQAHPGFPIQATYGGASYYGFANYWGINFQGLAIPDGQPVAGLSVTDQRPGNTTAYSVSKVGGKLTQWTQQTVTLDAFSGVPFNFYGSFSAGQAGSLASPPSSSNWVMQWDKAIQAFWVTGSESCSNNGCTLTALSPQVQVATSAFTNVPVGGWSNSYGGNINIPPNGSMSAHMNADPVNFYVQSTITPGTAPLTLYCLNQCPTALSLAAFSSGGQPAPWGNGTDNQWFNAPSAANTVTYTFGSSGLQESGSPVILELASQYPSGSSYAQNGIQTGNLFDTALASCPSGYPAGSVCAPANPSTYYTWQTGPQQWNQSLWLTTGSNVVPFDPPENIAYTVPAGAAFGSYAGLPILLQFNGFGNLYGIPGYCVSPVDNSTVPCTSNSRYVPMFSIPDGALMTLPSPSTPLIVKALNGEIRLGLSNGSNCASMSLTPLALPSGGLHDPSNSSDSEYLGTPPTVTAAPKVIDGVVQP